MSGIASVIDNTADADYYKNISTTYIARWEELGMSRDGTHAKLAYDWYGSWTTLYNLYADSLLCFHLPSNSSSLDTLPHTLDHHKQAPIKDDSKHKHRPRDDKAGFTPRHIYSLQSTHYASVRQKYGLPLDSRHLYTKTDWEFFAMAVSSKSTRSVILQSVATWLNETNTDRPFTDLHTTEGEGGFPGPNFFARPVVGGHFAFLALERACGGEGSKGLEWLDEE